MSAYYIWNPYINQESQNTLEFILTNGDVPSGFTHSKEFISNLIVDLKLYEEIKEWSVEPFRSSYYSEYLDGDYWQDIWQIIWKVHVITKEKLKLNIKQNAAWIGTNAIGEGWSEEPDDDSVIGCLVVSDFKSEKSLLSAIKKISSDELDELRKNYSVAKPKISRSIVLCEYKQLQINLSKFDGQFYLNGADYAKRILEICRNQGGITNWEEHEIPGG